jgi:hypothetical protein
LNNPFEAQISERELADKIIYMHDVLGLGFRRIATELGISKDRAFRLYHKYKPAQKVNTEQEISGRETKLLDQNIKKREQNVHLAKIKHEKRKQIAILMIQEAEVSFERRRELFENKKALLDFAEKVLPVINPPLWLRLEEVCDIIRIGLDDALQDAIGSQIEFEEMRMESLNEDDKYLFDEHLALRLEDWLLEQEEEIVEVSVMIEGDKGEELFKMQIPSRVLNPQ